jgi:PAS domain-containing protein
MLENNAHLKRDALLEQLEMYQLIFDSIYNGAIVTDVNGKITPFNKPYREFIGTWRKCWLTADSAKISSTA